MKNNKRILFLYGLALLLLGINARYTNAQNTEIYEGMLWYLDKEAAFKAAVDEKKQVYLLWGQPICYNCRLRREMLGRTGLKEIVDQNYILWYCDLNTYWYTSPVVSDYLYSLKEESAINLPVTCIIDTYDTTVAYGLMLGYMREESLVAYLNRYVSNDLIVDDTSEESIRAYVSGNILYIDSDKADESISVYSMAGSLIDKFSKTSGSYSRNTSIYPKGVLVVSSSAGWTRKIVVR